MRGDDIYRGKREPEERTSREGDRERYLLELTNYLVRVSDTLVNISNDCASIVSNQRLIADNQRICANTIINLQNRVSEVLEEVRHG